MKVIIYTKQNILELFKDVIEKEEVIWASNNEIIKTMYRGKIRTFKIYTAALAIFTVSAVVLLQGYGAVGVLQIKEHNKKFNTSLEPHSMYQTIIPLNKLEHVTFFFALEAFLAWVGVTYNCTTHMVFVVLLMFSASQLEMLQIRLRYYVEEDFPETPTEEQINEKIVLLKSFIRDHIYIIRFVQHYNNCTKYIIMAEFLLASFDLASVSINLTKQVPTYPILLV
ncbi:unnamed protein product [Ceutorhynchus assimilis]|uniref:Uncharacterized protein n=1 Tax=Ceutorhynchus assimilis TaxID=467358 RepID=A0A9P0DDT8_9CUCU|nr:unnamed protein product [Ceutorhynchus assimilis]